MAFALRAQLALARGIAKTAQGLRHAWPLRVVYERMPNAVRAKLSRWGASLFVSQFRLPVPSGRRARGSLEGSKQVPAKKNSSNDVPGVNIFTFVGGQFGLSESARLYAAALHGAGVPVVLRDVDIPLPHAMGDTNQSHLVGDTAVHATNMLFLNPDTMSAALQVIDPEELRGRHLMACWYWELTKIPPPWTVAMDRVESFLASSRFIADALRQATDKPVFHVPLPVVAPADAGMRRQDFGLPEGVFLFLVSFDFNSFVSRKNPGASIRAFQKAFPASRRDVALLIKTSNGHRYPGQLRSLVEMMRGDTRVLLRDGVVDRAQMGSLQRCADAYVSLHRSEGFGLGLAECMSIGKPVIATSWSGNMDFMTPDTALLVDYELVPVADGEYPYHQEQSWAEPSVEQAAEHMRYLVEHPVEARLLGDRAAAHIRATLAPDVIAAKLETALAAVSSGWHTPFQGNDSKSLMQ